MNVHLTLPSSFISLLGKYWCRHWVATEKALEPVGPDAKVRRQFSRVTGNRTTSVGHLTRSLFIVGCAFMLSGQGSKSRLSEKCFYLRRMIPLDRPRQRWEEVLNCIL